MTAPRSDTRFIGVARCRLSLSDGPCAPVPRKHAWPAGLLLAANAMLGKSPHVQVQNWYSHGGVCRPITACTVGLRTIIPHQGRFFDWQRTGLHQTVGTGRAGASLSCANRQPANKNCRPDALCKDALRGRNLWQKERHADGRLRTDGAQFGRGTRSAGGVRACDGGRSTSELRRQLAGGGVFCFFFFRYPDELTHGSFARAVGAPTDERSNNEHGIGGSPTHGRRISRREPQGCPPRIAPRRRRRRGCGDGQITRRENVIEEIESGEAKWALRVRAGSASCRLDLRLFRYRPNGRVAAVRIVAGRCRSSPRSPRSDVSKRLTDARETYRAERV